MPLVFSPFIYIPIRSIKCGSTTRKISIAVSNRMQEKVTRSRKITLELLNPKVSQSLVEFTTCVSGLALIKTEAKPFFGAG